MDSRSNEGTPADTAGFNTRPGAMTGADVARWIAENHDILARRIVAEWRQIGEREVWFGLPPAMQFDHLPDVIAAIADTALAANFERSACERTLHLSALHGEHRQVEGFPEHFVYTEYHLLRRSMWHFLYETVEPDAAALAVSRIDVAITLATMAGLRGFHRATFEQRGDWPAALWRVLEELPIPFRRGEV